MSVDLDPGPAGSTRDTVTVRAPAKVNLCLGVGPADAAGYHRLATVYQAIGMYDDVTAVDAPHWSVQVRAHQRIDAGEVPLGEDNIVLRAGRLLIGHHGVDRAAALVIDKGIPVAGGLAGGSADAAATLLALDRLWRLDTPDEVLLDLAGQLGSDVPFALVGGSALGSGHGELVRRVPDAGSWWWVVAESEVGLSTPGVYGRFDELSGTPVPEPEVDPALLEALAAGDPGRLAEALSNDLQPAALALRPDLGEVLRRGVAAGALAGQVSGSGPTCVFLCADHESAHAVRADLRAAGHQRVGVAPAPVAGAHRVVHE